eukprot:6619082-Prymnesium_polylepis.1
MGTIVYGCEHSRANHRGHRVGLRRPAGGSRAARCVCGWTLPVGVARSEQSGKLRPGSLVAATIAGER